MDDNHKSSNMISPLGPDDIPSLMELSQGVGWPHTERDWNAMISNGRTFGHRLGKTTSPYIGEGSPNNNNNKINSLMSCIHLQEYGTTFATLGMLIVAKPYRNRGLATSLVRHLLSQNSPSCRPMGLITATSAESFYPSFGFSCTAEHILKMMKHENRTNTFERLDHAITSSSHQVSSSITVPPEKVKQIVKFDRETTGLDRGPLVEHLLTTCDRVLMVEEQSDSSRVCGYGIAKSQQQGTLLTVGPVVAQDDASALELCRALSADHKGSVRMDVFESQPKLVDALMNNLGFEQEDRQSVMIRDPMVELVVDCEEAPILVLPGNRNTMYCPASQAWL